MLRVLVVDDEKDIRVTLSMCLESLNCQVVAAASAESALAAISHNTFDVAFLDLRLGETNGLDLIPRFLADSPQLAIVVVTAYATFNTAVEAIRRGAQDYLPKPFTAAQIGHVVKKFTEQRALTRQVADLAERLREEVPEADLDSGSAKMGAILEMLSRAARSDTAVLLRGESGTGKGVLARTLHARSRRAAGPFVLVHCPTLSEELLTSELFGHVRGAFTGAAGDRPGRVEMAEGGTLFLDEIGELSPVLQAKLLRFLQEKQFERLGENKTRRADVRVVAATNGNLEADVESGRFRKDLLYRLNVVEVMLPPLRERTEDILPLARRFVEFFGRTAHRSALELSPAADQALLAYPWPGNIRELRNAIERVVILWPARVIEPEAFPEHIVAHTAPGPSLGGDFSLSAIEREHIMRVVTRVPTLEEAAQVLGIDSSTLWRKRRRYEK